ncbi:RE1-silencing transcription factor isoform X4 [Eurytemora carolleeae]|uniref:RE1-silencing transcription factor isoform X4 n=1 Tax=Eurytemora carolleeae TaxID=1294199 RepID=UPI000C78C2AB|nr:RE1-silencing transcription factor isoform X4 [Eurytemora carolleeae]|eukprot:XP_023326220.1 RE1-silencing transcription factor-like isoform X4 [Eurytemora affinis]
MDVNVEDKIEDFETDRKDFSNEEDPVFCSVNVKEDVKMESIEIKSEPVIYMDEPSESELLFSSDHNHLTLKRKPKRERRAKTLQKFPCFECEYAATTRRLLKEHIESKHEVVVYPCVQCDYSATTAKNLRSHVECKHEGVRYPCLQCEYISNGRSDLRKHVRNKHEGVRYPCHICTYAATRPGDLKRHMERKHKGEPLTYADQAEFIEPEIEIKSDLERETKNIINRFTDQT